MSQEGYLTFLDLFLIICSLFSTYISLSNGAQNRKDLIVIFLTKFLKDFQAYPPRIFKPKILGGVGFLATVNSEDLCSPLKQSILQNRQERFQKVAYHNLSLIL